MIVRSLRMRLVLSMILIIGAALAATGIFSSLTFRRELDQFMVEQRRGAANDAVRLFREHDTRDAMREVHARYGLRTIIVRDGETLKYPPELERYRITFFPGGIELRQTEGGTAEALRFRIEPVRLQGIGAIYFLPPKAAEPGPLNVRTTTNRWLVAGVGAAALLAVLVMLTIFRRVFAPVEALTKGARALAGGRLDARVPVRGEDEVAELGRAFNSMADSLERNERTRRNMVSDVAHELRTPLTNMRVQIEAAQDGVIATDAKFLDSVAEEATNLARLVDDLQQLSLAEGGQLRLEIVEVRVAEIVERALRGYEQVVRNVPDDLVVHVDARRIVQVVRNLVVTAIQHAEQRVEVRAARVGERVEIRVIDDGPGVPEDQAERVFDRFVRLDPSRSRATGGAGLGLAIAKQLVELHGGRIWYERPAFVVALP
jgi:signal transduction histidine kinase